MIKQVPPLVFHIYVCMKGHVSFKPEHGTFPYCPVNVRLTDSDTGLPSRYGVAPCGGKLYPVADHDGGLQAAYLIGGPQAVLDMWPGPDEMFMAARSPGWRP